MVSPVFFFSLADPGAGHHGLEVPLDLEAGLSALGQALLQKDGFPEQGALGLKTYLGKPHRPVTITYPWHKTVAEALAPGEPWSAFDTLSITTKGLDEPTSFLEIARQKGVSACAVADDPALGAGETCGSPFAKVTCAAGLKQYDRLATLNPVRPHPHLGFWGAVADIGLGMVDRQTKLTLHEHVRPQVNTPLCAGCGSCLDVCIFDAIKFNGGRAAIDHTLCTGCAECMDACFMAGIAADQFGQVVTFQEEVADAATAVAAQQGALMACFNFLVRLDRSSGSGGRRQKLGDIGILASFDPVALDQATWDLLKQRTGENLAAWSGFSGDPEAMLTRAVHSGLGSRQYDLVEVLQKK